jgi:ribonuclease HII
LAAGTTHRLHNSEFYLNLWDYELSLAAGALNYGGTDEAGRGALAGPVVAACVVLTETPKDWWMTVNDSKRLPRKTREALHARIFSEAMGVGVGIATVEEIESMNILHASRLAMGRATVAVGQQIDLLLVDGNQHPLFETDSVPSRPIIGGDGKCLSIAAASIVAKVERDRVMMALHESFPQYGFNRHVGYGTKEHLQALAEHGPCPIHRMSFGPVKEASQVRLNIL